MPLFESQACQFGGLIGPAGTWSITGTRPPVAKPCLKRPVAGSVLVPVPLGAVRSIRRSAIAQELLSEVRTM
jgi:hypothetical protein